MFFNENDPKAAAWIKNLFPESEVDSSDIRDIIPSSIKHDQCHFFAGIGGWPYALQLAGHEHLPCWTGSCPCQPFSTAGRGKGTADERHLWPHWFHLIRVCRPPIIFGEQVSSKAGLAWLDLVSADLEAEGYAVGAADLCAASVGAPHIRQRLFFGAYDTRLAPGWLGDAESKGRERGTHGAAVAGQESQGARNGRLTGSSNDFSGVGDAKGDGWGQSRLHDSGNPSTNGKRARTVNGHAGETRGVGDANGGDACPEREQRGRQHGFQPEGGCTSGLADSSSAGLQERISNGGVQRGALEAFKRETTFGSRDAGHPAPTDGFWRDADWLGCRDGKWRPVEPGSKPLVNGVSGRVGLLRGYGNAIVPQVAAEFVTAFLEEIKCIQ